MFNVHSQFVIIAIKTGPTVSRCHDMFCVVASQIALKSRTNLLRQTLLFHFASLSGRGGSVEGDVYGGKSKHEKGLTTSAFHDPGPSLSLTVQKS